jgi:hypothetical protein
VFSGCRVNLPDQKQVLKKEIGVVEPKVVGKAMVKVFSDKFFGSS